YIMSHVDAQRSQFPSRNTVERLGKICNRVRTVLEARAKGPAELRIEEGHASADVLAWNMHPVPFFGSVIVKNTWLAQYNRLTMMALTNLYQHSDNNLALTITVEMANSVLTFFQEIAVHMGTELLNMTATEIRTPGFQFTQEHYDLYSTIADRVISTEALNTPGPIQSSATEDDLRPFFQGIPSTIIGPLLAEYPVGKLGEGDSGSPFPLGGSAPGTEDGSAIQRPGRNLGDPQL
ncbi:MAG: hypothetical protein ACPG77_11440, partial [Nannocystaceae bacterium]